MPRARSDEKRRAILEAATRIIVTQGLSAPTAGIAKEADVANGSLFTYFETKTELFNQLYLELKSEMASAALKGLPEGADLRDQLFHVWRNWTNFAVSFPEKRRALAQLGVSDDVTAQTRVSAQKMMAPLGELLERSRANGPMQAVPMGFLGTLMNAVVESTMDYMSHDPTNAKKHCKTGFEALWRMLSS
jgi:AcrR family transcriptional regulator